MEFERLKRIINYNREHSEILQEVKEFYNKIGMEQGRELLNIMQVVQPWLQKNRFVILEIPFRDKEIGAMCYKGDCFGYVFLNSALPKVNVNFALCHELYHIFCQEKWIGSSVELYINEHYYEHEDEMAANGFAGNILMPEMSFRGMYRKFNEEAGEQDGELSLIVKLMNYFQAPYMAVLIRAYEMRLFPDGDVLRKMLAVQKTDIEAEFSRLWLDDEILYPTRRDDFPRLKAVVNAFGEDCIDNGLFNEKTLMAIRKNITDIYMDIREEGYGKKSI